MVEAACVIYYDDGAGLQAWGEDSVHYYDVVAPCKEAYGPGGVCASLDYPCVDASLPEQPAGYEAGCIVPVDLAA